MAHAMKLIVTCLSLAALAACGRDTPERAVLGAGAGAGAAVVLSGGLAAGALIGAGGNVAYCKTYPSRCR